jgi:hypothetical protein
LFGAGLYIIFYTVDIFPDLEVILHNLKASGVVKNLQTFWFMYYKLNRAVSAPLNYNTTLKETFEKPSVMRVFLFMPD